MRTAVLVGEEQVDPVSSFTSVLGRAAFCAVASERFAPIQFKSVIIIQDI